MIVSLRLTVDAVALADDTDDDDDDEGVGDGGGGGGRIAEAGRVFTGTIAGELSFRMGREIPATGLTIIVFC